MLTRRSRDLPVYSIWMRISAVSHCQLGAKSNVCVYSPQLARSCTHDTSLESLAKLILEITLSMPHVTEMGSYVAG